MEAVEVVQAVAQVDAQAAEANHASIETIAHLRVLAEVVAVAEMMMAVVVVVVGRATVWPWWWRWPRSQLIN